MSIQQSYDLWSHQYDSDDNKTRDLEAMALRTMLQSIIVKRCLELGCGTGKNTDWLQKIADQVIAVDGSQGMLSRASKKIKADHVHFVQADILNDWHFANANVDLIVCSLVLEHIENLLPVFEKASAHLNPGGLLYIGELHPFKQYHGSKARFQTAAGLQHPDCFTHHVSEFINGASINGMRLDLLREFLDEDSGRGIPRILSMLFRKV